jgi:hypothetical protein
LPANAGATAKRPIAKTATSPVVSSLTASFLPVARHDDSPAEYDIGAIRHAGSSALQTCAEPHGSADVSEPDGYSGRGAAAGSCHPTSAYRKLRNLHFSPPP